MKGIEWTCYNCTQGINVSNIQISFSDIICTTWYIGINMTEKSTCGSSYNNPCSDLLHTIDKAKGGDTLMVNSLGSHDQPIDVCCQDFISKSITMIGYNGQPRLTCNKEGQFGPILIFTSVAYKYMQEYYSTTLQGNNEQYQRHTLKKQDGETEHGLNIQNERNGSINMENHLLHYVKYVFPFHQCYKLWTNDENINVHVENMYFVSGYILACDISVSFVRCTFIDASIQTNNIVRRSWCHD